MRVYLWCGISILYISYLVFICMPGVTTGTGKLGLYCCVCVISFGTIVFQIVAIQREWEGGGGGDVSKTTE